MKRQIIISIAVLFMVSLSSVAAPVNAQTKVTNQTEQKAWIKYEGSNNGVLLFDLAYYNPSGKKLSITIFDGDHNNLFEGFYTDKTFHKRFEIPSGDANDKRHCGK